MGRFGVVNICTALFLLLYGKALPRNIDYYILLLYHPLLFLHLSYESLVLLIHSVSESNFIVSKYAFDLRILLIEKCSEGKRFLKLFFS
jgi:uncharacterized membrane protein YcgQ (UPF0703/DUF1980 family)